MSPRLQSLRPTVYFFHPPSEKGGGGVLAPRLEKENRENHQLSRFLTCRDNSRERSQTVYKYETKIFHTIPSVEFLDIDEIHNYPERLQTQ